MLPSLLSCLLSLLNLAKRFSLELDQFPGLCPWTS